MGYKRRWKKPTAPDSEPVIKERQVQSMHAIIETGGKQYTVAEGDVVFIEKIEQNAAAYSQKLEALDQELREELSGLENRDIVTFHEAFPYFAKAYDLNVVAVLALEPDEALTPQMLKGLVEKVKEAGLPPLFTEPQFEDRAAKAVAQETGAKIYELDPIVTGDGQPDAYETGMRKNAQALIEALGE